MSCRALLGASLCLVLIGVDGHCQIEAVAKAGMVFELAYSGCIKGAKKNVFSTVYAPV